MTKILGQALHNYPRPYVTDSELESLLDGTPDSRYGKVKRMIAQGKLLHIRRGLYCLTNEMGYFRKPSLFELAQYIYGPSLISLESALSFHNLIPEAVYTTTSVAGKRSKEVETPLGRFSYRQVPQQDLFTATVLCREDTQQFFIAKPWRAICDYVFCYRLDWRSVEPLINSLRIEVDSLPRLLTEEAQLLDNYYQHSRISRFLKGIQKDLHQIFR
jgi:hypothetical protein